MKYILYVHVYICSFIASILCDKCFTRINKLLLYCIVLYVHLYYGLKFKLYIYAYNVSYLHVQYAIFIHDVWHLYVVACG